MNYILTPFIWYIIKNKVITNYYIIPYTPKEFGNTFVNLARAVYFTNDERAEIKKKINLKTGSKLVEEKDYVEYK